MIKLEVRRNAYYDSVTLMLISKELKQLSGVDEALVGMGTELNREIARGIGLASPELEQLGANDFFVALRCSADETLKAALIKVDELLNRRAESGETEYFPPTLESALKLDKNLNMALISVPGRHAAPVAQGCLDNDINVLLFSDNVSLDEERSLKEYACRKGLLMMGPDCGTAIINNVPLAFANVVRKGDIGIVAASGTGTQEVCSVIDRLGGGVSQVIGTGGRDLRKEIGGIMMKYALRALADDPATRVIVLISKPPAREVADELLRLAAGAKKPVVVSFIGGRREDIEAFGLVAAVSLEDAAHKAVALSRGEKTVDFTGFSQNGDEIAALARAEAERMAPQQCYVRGFFTGGTLCDEAMKLMIPVLGHIYSNIPLSACDRLENARSAASREHCFLDFGDDEFTVGRPHPMIDPQPRAERVVTDSLDPDCAVILLDCVIGYGSHEDPAHDLAEAIVKAKANARAQGRYLCVAVSVCGTEGDPQSLSATRDRLSAAGAVVLPSNAQASRFALLVLSFLNGRAEG